MPAYKFDEELKREGDAANMRAPRIRWKISTLSSNQMLPYRQAMGHQIFLGNLVLWIHR
jgi:hypothetical protein